MSDPRDAVVGLSLSPSARRDRTPWPPHPGIGPRSKRSGPAAFSLDDPYGDEPEAREDGSLRAASANVLTLVFNGTFDAFAVERTRQALAEMSDQDHLVLDISKVHDVDWCALANLAADVVELAPARVSLTGYCEQHARLLSYLGLEMLLESSTRPHAPGTFRRMRLVRR